MAGLRFGIQQTNPRRLVLCLESDDQRQTVSAIPNLSFSLEIAISICVATTPLHQSAYSTGKDPFTMDLMYSYRAYSESWIEVSSRPSSSSLSSAAADESFAQRPGLAQDINARRRRRLQRSAATSANQRLLVRPRSATGSSQEEYEESESESDRIMTSSNEDMQPRFVAGEEENGESPTDNTSLASPGETYVSSDDENATALGVVDPSPVFRPQPNAFSHPPSTRMAQNNASRSSGPYLPSTNSTSDQVSRATSMASATRSSRSSYSREHNRSRSHLPYNVIAPNHTGQVDHDAALRASLSTLLSCAAAARGLQKREEGPASSSNANCHGPAPQPGPVVSGRVEQGTLRLIPESALDSTDEPRPPLPRRPPPPPKSDPSSAPATPAKRKSRSPTRDRRKKHRSGYVLGGEDALGTVSPTLTTWVVSAGVLVLFSAISFSAGYALGREVGRVDAMGGGSVGYGCAREVDGGLGRELVRSRAWRWGNASGVRA